MAYNALFRFFYISYQASICKKLFYLQLEGASFKAAKDALQLIREACVGG